MNRREYFCFVSGAFVALSGVTAGAQQADRPRRVASLMAGIEERGRQLATAFEAALSEHGWHKGRNIELVYRWSGGDVERMSAYASELVALHPDVIMAQSSQAVLAVQRETRSIPIVFRELVDPVVTGLVQSFARPGGNITGFTHFEPSMMGKHVEFLKEIAPNITCLVLLRNPATSAPQSDKFTQSLEAAALSLKLRSVEVHVHRAADLETIVAAISREQSCGVYVAPSSFFVTHQLEVIGLMAQYGLPAVYGFRGQVESGGLLSYGVDLLQASRDVASYVDRILRGEKPADLPVQAPTKYELVINLKTAKALGLTIPPLLLARASEVIE
jgi:putative tryptophan/tyrosine transport system substrate-binding protein